MNELNGKALLRKELVSPKLREALQITESLNKGLEDWGTEIGCLELADSCHRKS